MYATIDDMVRRFGRVEIIRLSAADGLIPDDIIPDRIVGALVDASDLIDSYLRDHYRLPLRPVPPSITRAACILARYDLSNGNSLEPSSEVKSAWDREIAWLKSIADGKAKLEVDGVTSPSSSGAMVQDRPPAFTNKNLERW